MTKPGRPRHQGDGGEQSYDAQGLHRVRAALLSLPGVTDATVRASDDTSDDTSGNTAEETAPQTGSPRITAHVLAPGGDATALRAAVTPLLPAHLVPHRIDIVTTLPTPPADPPHPPAPAPAKPPNPDGPADPLDAGHTPPPPTDDGRPATSEAGAPEPPDAGRASASPGGEGCPATSEAGAPEPPDAGHVPASPAGDGRPVPPEASTSEPPDAGHAPAPPADDRPSAVPEAGVPDGPRAPQPVLITPQQRALLHDALDRSAACYVAQFVWRWRGPLDLGRVTAAWQSVARRETVRRTAFDVEGATCALLHESAVVDVVRHPAGSVEWETLLERDRRRGFDLGRPALLRLTLVDDPAHGAARASTRVLLTYHHLLLDGWSVCVLLQEFYRAYLGRGTLPGGERRPDMRDYTRWLAAQRTEPAREFWSRTLPAAPTAVEPALPGPATGQRGTGRATARIGSVEADRLRLWAAGHGAAESSVLHAVWAMLLYRARGKKKTKHTGLRVGGGGGDRPR